MRTKWFAYHAAYTMAKYGMSMCVLGMAEEFKGHGIAVNALWPESTIITAATKMLGSAVAVNSRTPQIMVDAAYAIFCKTASEMTGCFMLDTEMLTNEGVSDFAKYLEDPNVVPNPDFFVDEDQLITLKSSL